jgi:dihydroorotase
MKTLLINGKVFLDGKLKEKNLLIEKEKIADITDSQPQADQTIDCEGKLILPGMIDSHVHFRTPGFEFKEDWLTGSSSAVAGGVTTVLDMPNNKPPTTTKERLEEKRNIAARDSLCNFGFHFGAAEDNLAELRKVEKVAGFKAFMGSSTGNLLVDKPEKLIEIFKIGKERQLPVSVHAEDEELVQKNVSAAKEKGWNSIEHYAHIRDNEVEWKAIEKALQLAKEAGNKLHVCHVSTKEGVELIRQAKKDGQAVTLETTPHNLLMTREEIKELGNLAKMNAPVKFPEDQEALWQALNEGLVDTLGSDHAPHTLEEKKRGFWEAPAGVPGVETILPLMLNAVNEGRVTLEILVRVCMENPARVFGLKQKGYIKEGFDADLILVDLEREWTVENSLLFTKCGWSPYAGKKLKGKVVRTFVLGQEVFNENTVNQNVRGREVEF